MMNLPFSEQQFLDVFGHYNRMLGPAAASLWVATLIAVVVWVRRPAKFGRLLAIVVALNWAWSGVAYHLVFFTTINPAASVFGTLFVVEALLITWAGWRGDEFQTLSSSSFWRTAGIIFVGYSLLYPALVLASGFSYPRMPTFGVPCPTTLLTIGVLIMISSVPRVAAIIPIGWCAVAGMAAVMFGVYPDLALLIGGLALLAKVLTPRHLTRRSGADSEASGLRS